MPGADYGELRRCGQCPEPDESTNHSRERKQDEDVPRKGEEHERNRATDAVASPANRVEFINEACGCGEREEHRESE